MVTMNRQGRLHNNSRQPRPDLGTSFFGDWRKTLCLRNGQLLVESMISISLLVVGFLAIFSLLSRSISLNRVAADNYTATYLAAEGIEVARNMVDANAIQKQPSWNCGFADGDYEVEYNTGETSTNSCIPLTPSQDRFLSFDPGTGLFSYSGTNPTSFKRLIRIVLVNKNEIKINSIVSWTTLGGGYRIDVEDHFFNRIPPKSAD